MLDFINLVTLILGAGLIGAVLGQVVDDRNFARGYDLGRQDGIALGRRLRWQAHPTDES